MMGNAGDLEIDVVALTGDIVSFPSQAAIEFVSEALSKLDTEVLYTCGNHDWALSRVGWPRKNCARNGGLC